MAGRLLRSGTLAEFGALGAVSKPVYVAAPQIIAATRMELGNEIAQIFAIPKKSESGQAIDWYAPTQGEEVIPWSAASPEERRHAKALLLEARTKIAEQSEAIQAGGAQGERAVFGKLLGEATQIPSDEHVFLVDKKPVITFWGFHPLGAPATLDVIPSLDVGDEVPTVAAAALPPVMPAPVAAAPIVGRRRAWWWWWLWLLLLLLALWALLCLLRGCGYTVPLLPIGDSDLDVRRIERPEVVDRDVYRVDREAAGRIDGVGIAGGSAGLDGAVGAEGDGIDAPLIEPDAAEGGLEPDGALADDLAPPEEGLPGADEPGEEPGAGDLPSPEEDPLAGETPPADPMAEAPESGAGGSEGTPLTIPQQAIAEGSTDFLKGKWRSETSLADRSHNPIDLSYEFEDGKGEVKLHRGTGADRVDCVGQATSTMKDGKLVIGHKDVRCPDGSGYQDSDVECTVGEDGRARCEGINESDGSTFDVDIMR